MDYLQNNSCQFDVGQGSCRAQNIVLYMDATARQQRGFNLIESMLALALLAGFMVIVVTFSSANMRKKDARILASQTEAFALNFTKYMRENRNAITDQAAQHSPVILSPQVLGANWSSDLATANMFQQTPCVAIVNNLLTNNLEAVLYYVGGNASKMKLADQLDIIHSSAIFLGGKGGVLVDGAILGNSGWQINNDSQFLLGANQCGANLNGGNAGLSENSVAINLDLMPDWNLNLQPVGALLRGVDNESGLLSLPGHSKNANTSKANIYFSANTGVIFDNSDSNQPIKLSVLYNGQGSKTPTIGFGSTVPTVLIGDTFKSTVQFKSGEFCTADEVGKIVADQGLDNLTNLYLARSNLVCTQNDMRCGIGNYCYLPVVANNIVFENNLIGVQDNYGKFVCPQEVPYALNASVGTPGGNVYVFLNLGSSNVPNSINTYQGYIAGGSGWQIFNCSGCSEMLQTDFSTSRNNNELLGLDLATISGVAVDTVSLAKPSITPITGTSGEYSTVIGYSISVESSSICANACASLTKNLGHSWQVLGTQRMLRIHESIEIDNSVLGCACERTDFGGNADNYAGIAAIIGGIKPIITAVTCSNAMVYSAGTS